MKFAEWMQFVVPGPQRKAARSKYKPRLETLESRYALSTVFVTTDADAGPGSFRDAIDQANTSALVDNVIIKNNISTINLASSVRYEGAQQLSIKGSGDAISGNGTFDLFVSEGNANLRLEKLTFRNGARGVFVPLSAAAVGTILVDLKHVTIENNTSHGLHIDDQTIGSEASIALKVKHATITGNGTAGAIDQDGIRVDEGGLGDIVAEIEQITISGNGGDGLELDERGDGSAHLSAKHANFVGNGFLVPADLDDGVDIDEADAGDIWVEAEHSRFIDNFEEGLDLNEAGIGDLIVELQHVEATGNGEEGIDIEEFADGNVWVSMDHVIANDNGREGMDLKERDNGNLVIVLRHVTTNGNAQDGVKADETGVGDLKISIDHLTTAGNGERGINLDEAGAGTLFAQLKHIFSSNPVADDLS